MNKVANTLSGMAMAVPLTVAAPVAFSSNAVPLPIGTQWHWDQQWRLPDRVQAGGYWDPTLVEWPGTPYRYTDRFQNIAKIGITPVLRWQDSSHAGWYVESGIGAHLPSAACNNGWRRLSTASQFGDYIGARYVTKSGVDVGLLLQHFPNNGIKHPDNGVNFAMLRTNEVTWTWTQTI